MSNSQQGSQQNPGNQGTHQDKEGAGHQQQQSGGNKTPQQGNNPGQQGQQSQHKDPAHGNK